MAPIKQTAFLRTRYVKAVQILTEAIQNREKEIQESRESIEGQADYEKEEHNRVSDSTSQWGNRVISYERTMDEELTIMKQLVTDKPGNLITLIRERIKLAYRAYRELEREEPEGPWSAANNAGELEAYSDIINDYSHAIRADE